MLRLRDGQGTLWDEFLPPEIRVLSEELAAIEPPRPLRLWGVLTSVESDSWTHAAVVG